mgnify:CR=1 FL=1
MIDNIQFFFRLEAKVSRLETQKNEYLQMEMKLLMLEREKAEWFIEFYE